MDVTKLLDEALGSRALVIGRPPPEGRDLDVLARRADVEAMGRRLAAEGFAHRDGRWVRFRDCTVDVVDLEAVESWRLPDHAVDELFATAEPLDGLTRLARPSPAHAALIEHRRWALGGVLTPSRRARLATDEVAPEVQRRASAWGVPTSLPAETPPLRRLRRRVQRPRGQVITFSGIDGSGKSSQVEALHQTLERLGYPVVHVWTRITINPSLYAVGAPVKKLVARAVRRAPTAAAPEGTDRSPGHGAAATDPGRAWRLRYPLVNHAWIAIVALANALTQWRAVTTHVVQGRIVLCDRYTLDSAAHLRYKYGPTSRFRMQARLIRLVSPRPLRSYFLDVPGAVAHARKPEKYTANDLEELAALYRDEHAWLRVTRLDGTRPPDELCRHIAEDVADALAQRRRSRRSGRTTR